MLPSNGPGTRSSRLSLIAALALALAACRDPNANVQTDAQPDCTHGGPPHVAHDGSVLLYAMTDLTIDPSDDPDRPHTGFDLDGFASGDTDPGGCQHPDYLSALDPEQNCAAVGAEHCTRFSPRCNCIDSLDLFPASMGHPSPCFGSIDNEFPTAVNAIQTVFNVDIRATALIAVNAGRLVLLVRVTGVDAFDDDLSVHVQLFRGFASPHTPCTVPMPGGTYQIERASLGAGGTTPNDSAVDLPGSIHDGRLRVVGTDTAIFTLLWPFASATPLALPSHHVTLAMDITHDAATRGNFGAWVTGDDAVTTFTPFTPPDGVNTLRGVVGGLADIEADGICGDRPTTPPTFGAISIGFGFDAVRVQLDATNPVVDGPMPGTCSFVSAADAGHD